MRGKVLKNRCLLTLLSGFYFSIPVWGELTYLTNDTPGSFSFCKTRDALPENSPTIIHPIYHALDFHQTDCFVLSGNHSFSRSVFSEIEQNILPQISQAMVFELALQISSTPDLYPRLQKHFETPDHNHNDYEAAVVQFSSKTTTNDMAADSFQSGQTQFLCSGCGNGDDDDDDDDPWDYFDVSFIPFHYQELNEEALQKLNEISEQWLRQMRGGRQNGTLNLPTPVLNIGSNYENRRLHPKSAKKKHRQFSTNVQKLLSNPDRGHRYFHLRLRYHSSGNDRKAKISKSFVTE